MSEVTQTHLSHVIKGGGYGETIKQASQDGVSVASTNISGANRDRVTSSITANGITVSATDYNHSAANYNHSNSDTVEVNGKQVHNKDLHEMVMGAVRNVFTPDADGVARVNSTEAGDLTKVVKRAQHVAKNTGRE